uniref:Uncharacterized protein n=1 Tax=Knipowitschia caucasica TaxID=637954 RepID=A0AAV2MMY7_KNICA
MLVFVHRHLTLLYVTKSNVLQTDPTLLEQSDSSAPALGRSRDTVPWKHAGQTSCRPPADLLQTSCRPPADLLQTSCRPPADLLL